MKLTKEQIELVEDYGLTFSDNYSGRFMFGEVTHAVSGDELQIRAFKSHLIDLRSDTSLDLLNQLDTARQDDLGKGIILY